MNQKINKHDALGNDTPVCFHSASESAENLTNHNEAELQRRCQERQQEINDMQEVLETKIQLLQEVGARHAHSGSWAHQKYL